MTTGEKAQKREGDFVISEERTPNGLIAFWPSRHALWAPGWLACCAVLMLVVYGVLVPLTAELAAMQAFADAVARVIPGFERAVALTDFERQARVMLAVDQAMMPVLVVLAIVLNFGVVTLSNADQRKRLLAGLILVGAMMYPYLYPYAPEAIKSGEYARKNLYPVLTSGLSGFAIVHGAFTVVISGAWTMFLLAVVRHQTLKRADKRYGRRWVGLGQHGGVNNADDAR